MKFLSPVFFIALLCHLSVQAMVPVLFSHGITDSGAQGLRYVYGAPINTFFPGAKTTEQYLFTQAPTTFDYPYAGSNWTRFAKASLSTLGQGNEPELLEKNYEKLIAEGADGVIVMGVSLGASTALNFVATKHPQKVRALILEAPFDRALNLARSLLKKVPYGQQIAPYALKTAFPYHQQESGLHPEEVVSAIAQDLPILLVSSEEDATVPCSSVIHLFNLLKNSGHTNVYVLVTEHGPHAKILWGPEGKNYQRVVHAFLSQYGLPCDASLAAAGKELLTACSEYTPAILPTL